MSKRIRPIFIDRLREIAEQRLRDAETKLRDSSSDIKAAVCLFTLPTLETWVRTAIIEYISTLTSVAESAEQSDMAGEVFDNLREIINKALDVGEEVIARVYSLQQMCRDIE